MDEAVKARISKLRYQRGFRAGERGNGPSESCRDYIRGYQDGKKSVEPGARWRTEKLPL